VSQAPTRDARTQLVLIVIAIAVGGAVFATIGDFVIGVGVGAAVFAVTRQAMRIWRPSVDHPASAASEADRSPVDR